MAGKGKGKELQGRQEASSSRGSIEPSQSTGSNDDQHWHYVNQENCPVRYRDIHNNLSGFTSLQDTDVILLLTPLVPPRQGTPDEHHQYDPYEYFGRALRSRHQRGKYVRRDGLGEDRGDGVMDAGDDLRETLKVHQEGGAGAVAHVSYTNENRITSIHRGFMRLAKLVILVVNNTSDENHPHFHAANIARTIYEEQFGSKREISLVLTNNTPGAFDLYKEAPTVIQTADYSKASLDAIAGIIFREIGARSEPANPGASTPYCKITCAISIAGLTN